MKICLVAEEYAFLNYGGGVGVYTRNLAVALYKLGHTVHIVTSLNEKIAKSVFEDGIYIHYVKNIKLLPITGRRFWGSVIKNTLYKLERSFAVWKQINKIARDEGLDVVEVPLWGAEGFIYAMIRRTRTAPLVVRLETPLVRVLEVQHQKMTFDLHIAAWMEAMTARCADKVIAISDAIRQEVSHHYKLDASTIVVKPLGIPIVETEYLQPFSDTDDMFRVMYLGRLETRKGTTTLLNAISLVLKCCPKAEFIIIGKDKPEAPGGLTYQDYARQILQPEVLQHVIFTGPLPRVEVNQHFVEASIFVAPSVYESFGIVYLEAMSWGKPVVGCLVGGIPEVVADGETGLLVPPENAEALADAIVQLLSNVSLRRRMSVAARTRVETYFTDAAMAKSTLDVYHDAIHTICRSSVTVTE